MESVSDRFLEVKIGKKNFDKKKHQICHLLLFNKNSGSTYKLNGLAVC